MNLDFKGSIRQFEAEIDQRSRNLRFRRQNVHSRLAQVKQNAFHLASIGQGKFDRSLHGNAVGAAPFAIQQSSDRTQAGFSLFFGERLIQHEMRPAAQNVARFGAFRNQCHGDGRASRIQPAAFFEDFRGSLSVFEIDNESVESLLPKTIDGSRRDR